MRILDIVFSLFLLFILLPVFFPVMLILKFTGENEIFYLQNRIGKNMSKFKLYKFTTMLKNSENMGSGAITVQGDSRVLPFGRFLRKSKINELPQLINILIGDMSFVGPRPLLDKQFGFYSKTDQKIISSVAPGLTGVGSLAFRDEEKLFINNDNPDKVYKEKITPIKAKLEIWYVSNKSFFLNIKIILFTFLAVLFPNKKFIGKINNDLEEIYEELLG